MLSLDDTNFLRALRNPRYVFDSSAVDGHFSISRGGRTADRENRIGRNSLAVASLARTKARAVRRRDNCFVQRNNVVTDVAVKSEDAGRDRARFTCHLREKGRTRALFPHALSLPSQRFQRGARLNEQRRAAAPNRRRQSATPPLPLGRKLSVARNPEKKISPAILPKNSSPRCTRVLSSAERRDSSSSRLHSVAARKFPGNS